MSSWNQEEKEQPLLLYFGEFETLDILIDWKQLHRQLIFCKDIMHVFIFIERSLL